MILPLLVVAQAATARGPINLPGDLPATWPGYRHPDAIARGIGRTRLRTLRLPPRDLELRVWSMFLGGPDLFRLTRRAGAWQAEIRRAGPLPGTGRWGYRNLSAPPPERGWNALWADLETLGLLTVPDEASLPDDGVTVFDGTRYLFEVRRGDRYRAFFYDNPEAHPKKPPARAVARMARLLRRELPFHTL